MNNKLHSIAALATILATIFTIAGFFLPFSTNNKNQADHIAKYDSATILILGSNTEIRIKKGSPNIPLSGGTFSSSGIKQTLYLPIGQKLQINVFGSGANIGIEGSIAPFININSNASGTYVHEL